MSAYTKMKTEILKQVASLRLEKTFLSLRFAAVVRIGKDDVSDPLKTERDGQQRLHHVGRKWSSDSGIVAGEYNRKHQLQVEDWSQE